MKIILAAVAMACATLAMAAHAGPSSFPPNRILSGQSESSRTADWMGKVVVRYDGLDLNKEADARFLYKRLEKAAATVCSHHASDRDMARGMLRMRSCEKVAMAQAVQSLGAPMVASLHDGRRASGTLAALFGFAKPQRPNVVSATFGASIR